MAVALLVFAYVAIRPADADAALGRAADCLGRDDYPAAVPHLRAYLAVNPDAVLVRFQLAEVLFRTGHPAAGGEFARVVADAGPAMAARLPHCHTRLMTLADAAGDRYRAHLHRGIGLALLADGWASDPARRDADATERTRTQAAAELRLAVSVRPDDPRANLHLAVVLDRLGQPGPARAARAAARRGLPDPSLTPADRSAIVDSPD
jgi:predicted Zn-dependent protease